MHSRCHARPVQARRSLFSNMLIFCNRKTTFSSQIATWPALALGSRISLLENRISLLDAYTKILTSSLPNGVLVITYTIWLCLEFRDRCSAWFFSAHLLFCHAWGRIFEPGIRLLDLGSTFWPGDLFGVKYGSPKKWFCDESIWSW